MAGTKELLLRPLKTFLVPCLVVVEAEDEDTANMMAGRYMSGNSVQPPRRRLLLDEELPTVELDQDYDDEGPYTIVGKIPLKR